MKARTLILAMLLFAQFALAATGDVDQDGIADSIDKYPFDYDNDGLPDIWEKRFGLRYDVANANGDPDNDGVKNIHEYERGTDPLVSDATGERVQPEFLRPVEKTWIKVSVWVLGVAFFVLLLFVIYKSNIFRFKGQQKLRPMRQPAPVYRRNVVRFRPYPGRVQMPPRRAFRTPYLQRPVRRNNLQRPIAREQGNLQRPVFREQGNLQRPVVSRDNPPRPFVREQGNVQRAVREQGDEPAYSDKPVITDVFEKLSKEVHEYNTSERGIKKLYAIR